jgi:hypothetical protein
LVPWNAQSPRDRGASKKNIERPADIAELADADEIGRFIKADEVSHPGEYGNIDDR